jgi:hypothetical protein
LRWRMISCPAANEMRWVNPSIATVSPSRTSSAIASRIVATLEMLTRQVSGSGCARGLLAGGLDLVERARVGDLGEDFIAVAGYGGNGLAEDPQRCDHFGLADGQGR